MTERKSHPLEHALERSRIRLRDGELVYNAYFAIRSGGRHKLARVEAEALLDAYLEAQATITKLRVQAERLAADAAAQRAVVERLTDELDKHQKGNG